MTRSLSLSMAFVLAVPTLAWAGFEVSTYRKTSRSDSAEWNAGSALDSRLDTCWMVDPETPNEGQWIQVDVPTGEVDKISLVTGWTQSAETFTDYARVKAARIEIFDMGVGEPRLLAEQRVEFPDSSERQVIDLPDTRITGEILGGRVRLTVTEVYPGKDFPSLAVSEFLVHMKEFDTTGLRFTEEPATSAADHAPAAMLDGNARTFWASADAKPAGFTIEAPRYGISSIGILPGARPYARPKTIEVQVGTNSRRFEVADRAEAQWFELPALVGYSGSLWGPITVQVIDTWEGTTPGVAIAEVKLKATNLEEF